jgi:hypothetical protein
MFITSKNNKKRGSVNIDNLHHFHDFSVAACREMHHPIRQGKKGIVASDPHVIAGMEPCSTLPHDYLTGADCLPAIPFHAQHLGIGISAVPR